MSNQNPFFFVFSLSLSLSLAWVVTNSSFGKTKMGIGKIG